MGEDRFYGGGQSQLFDSLFQRPLVPWAQIRPGFEQNSLFGEGGGAHPAPAVAGALQPAVVDAHQVAVTGQPDIAFEAVRALVDWYNEDHFHVGLALLHPVDVHHGRTADIVAARQRVLDDWRKIGPYREKGFIADWP